MYDWIEIGGVRSDAVGTGVIVLKYSLPPMAGLTRERTQIPGRLAALVSDYAQPEAMEISVELAVTGTSLADAWARYDALGVVRWLGGIALPWPQRQLTAPAQMDVQAGAWNTVLRLDARPNHYYVGALTGIDSTEEVDGWLRIKAQYTINPPCGQRARSKQVGYIPALTLPPPEQITAETETCSVALAANGWMPDIAYEGLHAAALYLCITGTWTRLQVGGVTGLTLEWPRATATTVYIDCEAEQCYYIQDDERISLSSVMSGDYPTLRESGGVAIGGDGIDIVARLLVVDRT